jgi:hypothetical protein
MLLLTKLLEETKNKTEDKTIFCFDKLFIIVGADF